jgi:hypothetical protein
VLTVRTLNKPKLNVPCTNRLLCFAGTLLSILCIFYSPSAISAEMQGEPEWFKAAKIDAQEIEEMNWTLKAVNCRRKKGKFYDIQLRRVSSSGKVLELNRHFRTGLPNFSISIRAKIGGMEIRSGNISWSSIGVSSRYRWNREISKEILDKISKSGKYIAFIKVYGHLDTVTRIGEWYNLVTHKIKIQNPREIAKCLF